MSASDMNMTKALVTLQNNFISIHIYASFFKKNGHLNNLQILNNDSPGSAFNMI